ncbi:MAG TPA: DUF3775 domain-containing protein [Rhodopila sp.]
MLYELDVLEARHIADLAMDMRDVRDRMLTPMRDADLSEPEPAHGEHNPLGEVVLSDVLVGEPAFVALHGALVALPADIRDKLWVLTQIGRGSLAVSRWDHAIDTAEALPGDCVIGNLLDDPDLHDHLRKGLYLVGAAAGFGDAG